MNVIERLLNLAKIEGIDVTEFLCELAELRRKADLVPVLRFRKTEHGFYREIDLEGNWLHEDGINEREVQYYNQQTAIKDCERRGLTAVFMEADDGE